MALNPKQYQILVILATLAQMRQLRYLKTGCQNTLTYAQIILSLPNVVPELWHISDQNSATLHKVGHFGAGASTRSHVYDAYQNALCYSYDTLLSFCAYLAPVSFGALNRKIYHCAVR